MNRPRWLVLGLSAALLFYSGVRVLGGGSPALALALFALGGAGVWTLALLWRDRYK